MVPNNNIQITAIKPHTKRYKQAATFPQAQPANITRTNISYVERIRSLPQHHARGATQPVLLTLTAITYPAIAKPPQYAPKQSNRNNLLAFKIHDTRHQKITLLYQLRLPMARNYSSFPTGNLARSAIAMNRILINMFDVSESALCNIPLIVQPYYGLVHRTRLVPQAKLLSDILALDRAPTLPSLTTQNGQCPACCNARSARSGFSRCSHCISANNPRVS